MANKFMGVAASKAVSSYVQAKLAGAADQQAGQAARAELQVELRSAFDALDKGLQDALRPGADGPRREPADASGTAAARHRQRLARLQCCGGPEGRREQLDAARAHSITSVARASTPGGTASRRAAAVRRLISRSKRAFCCTGSCAGGVPRRMPST